MDPARHSMVHGISVVSAALFGLVFGSLLGSYLSSTLESPAPWISAVGAGIGIVIGVWGTSFVVRRLIPVRCLSCGHKMICRIVAYDADTSMGKYTCTHCGETKCPHMERWIRVLEIARIHKNTKDDEND